MYVKEVMWYLSSSQAERSHPGLAQDFLAGLLEAEGVSLNLSEALLQLACKDGGQYTIESSEKEYVMLNERARGDPQPLSSSFCL